MLTCFIARADWWTRLSLVAPRRKSTSGPRARNLLRCGYQDRVVAVEVGEELLQVRHLREVVEGDVGVVGMQVGEVLVVALGRVEHRQWIDAGDDRAAEDRGLVELGDIGLG